VKYSQEGQAIEITLGGYNGHAEVRVRDHGAGIDEREVSSLFVRFGQGPGLRTSGGARTRSLHLQADRRSARRHGVRASARRRLGLRLHASRRTERLSTGPARGCYGASRGGRPSATSVRRGRK
jgi:hypothetical protein